MGKLKAIVFDLDGTLIDSVELHVEAWIRAFASFGIRVSREEIVELIGLPAIDIAKKFARDVPIGTIVKLKRSIYSSLMDRAKLYPDVLPALKKIREFGLKIGIASSSSRAIIEKIVAKHGLELYIDAITGGDEVIKGKPDPEIFMKTFAKLKVNPREGMVVGDTLYDIIPAKEIGAIAILISRKGDPPRSTSRIGPDYIIENLLELVELVAMYCSNLGIEVPTSTSSIPNTSL